MSAYIPTNVISIKYQEQRDVSAYIPTNVISITCQGTCLKKGFIKQTQNMVNSENTKLSFLTLL